MEGIDTNMVSGLISTLGIGGALVWYLYYTTSVTMPKRDEHYSKVLTEITSNFTESLREEREFRRVETQEMKAIIRESRCRMTDEQLRKVNGT